MPDSNSPGKLPAPVVRQRPLKDLPFGMILFILVIASAACSKRAAENKREGKETASKPIPVQIVRVESQSYRRTVESVGSLFPDEEVTISSEVEGRVEQVLADVGDRVAQNQPLVKIATEELRLTLTQTQAAVQQIRAQLGLNEREELRDVSDSAEVKKAQADLNDAEQKFQRAKALLSRGLVAREAFDEAESRLKSARAAYDLAIQTVRNLQAKLAENRASMALAEKKLNDSTIRAPFSGEIKERNVTVGQYLKVQSPVMILVSVDPLRARLKIPERMAAWVLVGQEVSVSVEAYTGQTFSGRISRLNPSVDQQSRTFEAEALITNHDGKLKPGFFVKARIPSGLVDKALFVSEKAVQYSYGVYKVFAIDGAALKEKEVLIGEHPNQMVEIVSGLREGEDIALPAKGAELRDRATFEVVP